MTSLLLSVFVFILSMSLLAIADNDNYFTTSQERKLRAEYAAHTGIDVYRVSSETFVVGTPITGQVPSPAGASYIQQYSVTLLADATVRSTGSVVDGGRVLAAMTIVIPAGDFAQAYTVSGP